MSTVSTVCQRAAMLCSMCLLLISAGQTAHANEMVKRHMANYTPVSFPAHGKPDVTLKGYFIAGARGGAAPALVMLPACGGLMAPNGILVAPFYRDMVTEMTNAGVHVLLVDGFTPRGVRETCTVPYSERTLDIKTRADDALAGRAYLATRQDIAQDQVFLLTYGAAGGLTLLNKHNAGGFTGALMFYPQCDTVRGDFAPGAPIQAFVGAKDAWNPPGACTDLAARVVPGSAAFNVQVYPDTYHGFVMLREPYLYKGHPSLGPVMIGGNRAAAADAYQRMKAFIRGKAAR